MRECSPEIKEVFNNYTKAKARTRLIEFLKSPTKEEQEEKNRLKLFIATMDYLLSIFPEAQRIILSDFYINNKTMRQISHTINYSYEYACLLKTKATTELENILTNDNLFKDKLTNKVLSRLGENIVGKQNVYEELDKEDSQDYSLENEIKECASELLNMVDSIDNLIHRLSNLKVKIKSVGRKI